MLRIRARFWRRAMLSTKRAGGGNFKEWLPGMDSNHELDTFLKCHNLLILKSLQSHQKHQNHDLGTKSVQSRCAPSFNSSVNQNDRAIKPGKCLAGCGC